MKKILLLGASGDLGMVLVKILLEKDYKVIALVRNPKKLKIQNTNLKIIKGSPYDKHDLSESLDNVDVVISALGHGFRTDFPIQEKTFSALLPIMKSKNINRLITITGAGLILRTDPFSLVGFLTQKLFLLIDPYRMKDAAKQQELLENSNINWTVIRTPIHNNKINSKIKNVGLIQPMPWYTISRYAISKFMIECIENNYWIKKSPIIY